MLALEHTGFSHSDSGAVSCSAQGQSLHGTSNFPRPGIEPVSPALAGGSLSSRPPGKSYLDSDYPLDTILPTPLDTGFHEAKAARVFLDS